MDEQNNIQKTAVAPQKTAVAPQKTAVAPQKTAVAPQKTAVAPQKTAVAPGMGAPQSTAAPQPAGEKEITVGGKTYQVEKLISSGTEGDVFIVSDGHSRYALKRCHPGFHTNMAVMPALQKLNGKGYIADIIDYADDFELLECIPGGSAASANIRGNAQAILAITIKAAMALDQMHKVNILHKDVKPANILIKDTNTWDSVLCDFGIADILKADGTVSTPQNRTIIYAAPEMYAKDNIIFNEGNTFSELTAKADYYSLGMTILSLWMGEGAFLSKEHELAMDKNKGRITVPEDMPDPLAKICRGLLIKSVEKRWDYEKIERLLNGEDVPVDEAIIIEDLNITFNAAKHLSANTPEELASCMEEDPELGTKYLYRGQLEKWLKPYPELSIEMQEIVEKRYPKNQSMGYYAALCALNPAKPFSLTGTNRETGAEMSIDAVTLKDVSNFCNEAILSANSMDDVSVDMFKEWVRVRNASVVKDFPNLDDTHEAEEVHMLRIQMIDPLSDINLRNDTSHPDYAMTGESIGRFLNKVYNIFWNVCGGDTTIVENIWNRAEYAPMNRQISASTVVAVASNFVDNDSHYITNFFNTKANRFKEQMRFFLSATDDQSDDYQKKAGPGDSTFFAQQSWMKVIKGFGATPEYELVESGKTVTTLDELFLENKKTLKTEYEERGLMGFLAVNRMEDPTADLKPQFAYEELLRQYVEDLAKIDDKMEPVTRFRQAVKEAEKLLSEGKSKIHGLMARNITQYVLSIVFAVVPAVLLLAMLLFSIIENPVVNTDSLANSNLFWVIGFVIAAVIYSKTEDAGCLPAIIGGVILTVLLVLAVKFLGQYILYIYAFITLATLLFFGWKTLFSPSKYAERARKFSKPGFEEKVLEPLYFAFSDEDEFDSSLNAAFNDEEMAGWKADLKVRRWFMIMFIGAVWFLLLFSMLIPKSERFNRYSAPLVEKIFGKTAEAEKIPVYLELPMQRGDQGEQVRKLQEFLFQQGYTKNRPDGDYGRGTENVVKAFQKAVGLDATGVVDAKTIETINKIVAETPKEETVAEPITKKPAKTTKPKETVQPKETTTPPAASKPAKTETAGSSASSSEGSGSATAAPVTTTSAAPAPTSSGGTVSLEQLMKASKNKNNSEQ
jgi:serine/threonine protein kinase/peptidoglycan hydrolase-like protein with peptidoglycan-binding domain